MFSLFLILQLALGAPAQAASLWQKCAEAYGRLQGSESPAPPALRELDAWLKGEEMARRMKRGEAHSLRMAGGKGTLKVGIWHRDQRRMLAHLIRALREGSLNQIDAGEIASPKVLLLFDRLREMGEKEGLSFEIRGRFDISFLRERALSHQELPLEKTSPLYWSPAERAALPRAFAHLGLEDCEARGAGTFVLSVAAGRAAFSCK